MRLGWGRDGGPFFSRAPDVPQHEFFESGPILLCMGLFSRFCVRTCGAPPHSASKTRVNALTSASKTRVNALAPPDQVRGRLSLENAPGNQMTTTRAPTLTRPYRSITSSLRIRMQPDDTLVPIVQGSLEPWMR